MTDNILSVIINSELEKDQNFTLWLERFFLRDDIREKCTIEEFAIFFLNFVRSQTERFVRGNTSSSACDTPKKRLTSGSESKNISTLPSITQTINTSNINTKIINPTISCSNNTSDTIIIPTTFTSCPPVADKKFGIESSETQLNQFLSKSTEKSAKKSILFSFDNSNNNSNSTSTPKIYKNQKINSIFEENPEGNSNVFTDSTLEIKCGSRRQPTTISTSVTTKRHDFDNSLDFSILNYSASECTAVKSTNNVSELNFNDFPSLNRSFKSSSSTPVRKFNNNKSGSTDRSINNSPVASSFSTPGNSANSAGKTNRSRHSNPSTPISDNFRSQSSTLCLGDFFLTPSTSSTSHQGSSKQKFQGKRNQTKDSNRSLNTNQNSTSNSSNSNTNQSSQKQESNNNQKEVLKKSKGRRVIPTPVVVHLNSSTNTASALSFTSPAFRMNEGNILNLSKEEIIDKNNCVIEKERAKLKSQKHIIVKEFAAAELNESENSDFLRKNRIKSVADDIKFHASNTKVHQHHQEKQVINKKIDETTTETITTAKTTPSKTSNSTNNIETNGKQLNNTFIATLLKIDFNKITNQRILNKFIEIHSALIELNLVTNILNEFTYLINFFNINFLDFKNFLDSSIAISATLKLTATTATSLISASTTFAAPIKDIGSTATTLDFKEELNEEKISKEENQKNDEFNEKFLDSSNTSITINYSTELNSSNNKKSVVVMPIDDVIQEKSFSNKSPQNNNLVSEMKSVSSSETIARTEDLIKFLSKSDSTSSINIDPKLINHSSKLDLNNELDNVLKNFLNCIYYALGVLKEQKNYLALLDTTSLRVILNNDILKVLGKDLIDFLNEIFTKKCEILENSKSQLELSSNIFDNSGTFQKNVAYQSDSDTRNNFTSTKECESFKRQRDLFYVILRTWESKHLSPNWNFELFLGKKIEVLLTISENPINMAHLAKLFATQLIISLNFNEPPTDLDIDLSNIDMNKLSKLRQRLVAPSNFSQDYQFPGNQQFFKDFLMVTHSIIFIEQLKIVIISELLELNDSTYQTIDLITKTTNNSNNSSSGNSQQDNQENNCGSYDKNNVMISLGEQNQHQLLSSQQEYHEYVVRPEIISTMRVLGKFLGLLISRPFHYEGNRNFIIDNKQVELRNMLRPEFDVIEILKKSIINRRLLITLPWIIEYITMLDDITLKLDYYRKMMNYLYELYMKLTINNHYYDEKYVNLKKSSEFRNTVEDQQTSNKIKYDLIIERIENIDVNLQNLRPTSIFILRTCLGWLFEQFNIIDEYYTYRQSICKNSRPQRQNQYQIDTRFSNEMDELSLKHKNNSINVLKSDEQHLSNIVSNQQNQMEDISSNKSIILKSTTTNINTLNSTENTDDILNVLKITNSLDPLLENILNVSCPFLADFRVSIMPTILSKSLSRTGRLRHITTKILPETNPSTTLAVSASTSLLSSTVVVGLGSSSNENENLNPKIEKDSQTKLIEAFLHSQNLSVRRIVEFVIERTTSAVIKDFQMEILLKNKTEANLNVEKISSSNLKIVKTEIIEIFKSAYDEVIIKWNSSMADMIKVRVEKALDALLPNETLPIVKQTCASIIIQKCKLKTEIWRQANLNINNFYPKDIDLDAEKFVRNFSAKKNEHSTNLEIDIHQKLFPSQVFSKLQFWLHATIRRTEFVNVTDLLDFFDTLELTLKSHVLPTSYYRLCGVTTVILMQNIVLNHFQILTTELIQKFINIWNNEKMQEFSKIKEPHDDGKGSNKEVDDSEESDKSEKSSDDSTKQEDPNAVNIFNPILAECFVKSLCARKSKDAIEKFSEVIINIIVNDFLTVSYINDKFVTLFKQEWSADEYKNLTNILERISSNTKIKEITHDSTDANKSNLFMEMLSDLLRDIDEY